VEALKALNATAEIDQGQAIAWLASCQNPDGGFGWMPGDGWSEPLRTYLAVSALEVLGGLDDINLTGVIEYLERQQNPWSGDFWGNVAQTYAALHTLSILGALDSIDAQLAANYLIGCQNPDGGFGEWDRDTWSSLESTYYSIHGLQLVFGLPTVDIDTTPPTIMTPTQVPATDVMPNQTVTISVNVTDASGVQNVTLWYTINGGGWTPANMTSESGDTYTGEIPGQPAGTSIQYKIIAYDNAGNVAVQEYELSYHAYTVIPEFPLAMLLPLLMFATLVAVMLAKNRRQENA